MFLWLGLPRGIWSGLFGLFGASLRIGSAHYSFLFFWRNLISVLLCRAVPHLGRLVFLVSFLLFSWVWQYSFGWILNYFFGFLSLGHTFLLILRISGFLCLWALWTTCFLILRGGRREEVRTVYLVQDSKRICCMEILWLRGWIVWTMIFYVLKKVSSRTI